MLTIQDIIDNSTKDKGYNTIFIINGCEHWFTKSEKLKYIEIFFEGQTVAYSEYIDFDDYSDQVTNHVVLEHLKHLIRNNKINNFLNEHN